MRGLDSTCLRSRHDNLQCIRVRNRRNGPSTRRLDDAVEESGPLPPQREDVDGILLLLDVFVLVHGAEFHAAGFAGARRADAHALAEDCVAFPAKRATRDDAGCCFEGVLNFEGGVLFEGLMCLACFGLCGFLLEGIEYVYEEFEEDGWWWDVGWSDDCW